MNDKDFKRSLFERARDLRKQPTPSEDLVWQALRGRKLDGIKFRRQHPIGPMIVDFYAPKLQLVVEIDGEIHKSQQAADQDRQAMLESLGLTVLRFSAGQVEDHLGSVLAAIQAAAVEIQFTSRSASPPLER